MKGAPTQRPKVSVRLRAAHPSEATFADRGDSFPGLILEVDVTELFCEIVEALREALAPAAGNEWVDAKTFEHGPRSFRRLAKAGAFGVMSVGRRKVALKSEVDAYLRGQLRPLPAPETPDALASPARRAIANGRVARATPAGRDTDRRRIKTQRSSQWRTHVETKNRRLTTEAGRMAVREPGGAVSRVRTALGRGSSCVTGPTARRDAPARRTRRSVRASSFVRRRLRARRRRFGGISTSSTGERWASVRATALTERTFNRSSTSLGRR